MTSHAAVVARGWGKPCICGCGDMVLDVEKGTVTLSTPEAQGQTLGKQGHFNRKSVTLREGDYISLNGDTGEVLLGALPLQPVALDESEDIRNFMSWCVNYVMFAFTNTYHYICTTASAFFA